MRSYCNYCGLDVEFTEYRDNSHAVLLGNSHAELRNNSHAEIEVANPKLTIARAREAAIALQSVVALKPKPVIINGEQYLEYEDWQLLGQFYNYGVKTGEAVPVEVNGVPGAKAHADLIDMRTGILVGGAEAYCMRDEERWSTRPEYAWKEGERIKTGAELVPWFQLASMAQMRAGAKAYRNRLAWIAVLAGYRPTPAEEMTGKDRLPVAEIDPVSPLYCKEHKAMWFMRGKMKSYAHPVDGGKDCYMPKLTELSNSEKEELAEQQKPSVADLKRIKEVVNVKLTDYTSRGKDGKPSLKNGEYKEIKRRR